MAPGFWVEVPKRRYAAPTMQKVCKVFVLEADSFGAEVDGGCSPYAINKIEEQVRVMLEQFVEGFSVICMELWGPRPKGS